MTILTISQSEEEFMNRVNNILVAYTYDNKPVYFGEFNCSKAILKMMKNAMNPNLVQTLEENPVLVHCGPFANISIGVNSINATKLAMKLAPVVVTEAGFGGDLGAEKFLDIKCQLADIAPSVIVLVATVRALKLHGGVKFEDLDKENIEAMLAGTCNLQQHAENMRKYGVPVIVTANRFPSDTDAEINTLRAWCDRQGYDFALNEGAIKGSEGAEELAGKVAWLLSKTAADFKPLYPIGDKGWSIKDKIGKICHEIYRADYVEYTDLALEQIRKYEEMGYRDLAVCMAKTPSSFSDDAKLLGAPRNFAITVREVRLSAGAGFIVPLTGAVMTMPGLPKNPLACKM
jgi:formate--tetrahydrofolate ligase